MSLRKFIASILSHNLFLNQCFGTRQGHVYKLNSCENFETFGKSLELVNQLPRWSWLMQKKYFLKSCGDCPFKLPLHHFLETLSPYRYCSVYWEGGL